MTNLNNPKFALDFTGATLNPAITFSRTLNTATRVNSSGYIEVINANLPRFDYNPVTLACRGLLIEQSRANLQTYSADFANAAWTKTRSSVTPNAHIAPDGQTVATKLIADTTASSSHHVSKQVTTTASQTYTLSVFAKAAEYNTVALYAASSAFGRIFNLTNGSIGNPINNAPVDSKIESAGDGYYRCSITFVAGTANENCIHYVGNNGLTSFTGDGVSGIYIWGSQLELGAFGTSYIPTTAAAVTRNADVATITGTAFSGIWRSGPGSILVRALPSTVSGTRPLVQVDDATADNIIALRGNTTNPELYIRAGGSDQATIDAGTISAAAYRMAGAWQAGSAAASLNSGLAVNGAPASIPAVTQMRLGSDGTNYLNGHLQSLEYWDEFLTPATLQSVTTSAGYRSIVGPVMRDTIIA